MIRSTTWGRFLIGLFLAFNLGMLIWFFTATSYSSRQACLDVAPAAGLNPAYCLRQSDFSNQNVRNYWIIGDAVFLGVFFAAHFALNMKEPRPRDPGEDAKSGL